VVEKTESGYIVPDWDAKGQSTAAEVHDYHEKNRAKQKRYREKSKPLSSIPVTGDVTGYITGDVGEARTAEVSWPVREIPTSNKTRKTNYGKTTAT
jgi:hypothetical protein